MTTYLLDKQIERAIGYYEKSLETRSVTVTDRRLENDAITAYSLSATQAARFRIITYQMRTEALYAGNADD
jgi:hypothetical protein